MDQEGQMPASAGEEGVLRWAGGVVTAEDLRRRLNGQHRLVLSTRAVVTPLAAEYLTERGVQVARERSEMKQANQGGDGWAYAQQRPLPVVAAALKGLAAEGLRLVMSPVAADALPGRWARAIAQWVAAGPIEGAVVFCDNPALVCCVANKVKGIRAAAVTDGGQASQARLGLGVNMAAVGVPGRTLHEVRGALRALCMGGMPQCPQETAQTLLELDGHAHR